MAFDTILIANRGEIAMRINRTAQALGYRTVAVFSDADKAAPHVQEADVSVRIGPGPSRESYLRPEAILAAAAKAGAGAIHPGYGFLAENADFADAVRAAGLVFIGPPGAVIRRIGDKAAAKRLLAGTGVPLVPGYSGTDQTDEGLSAAARDVGFPLMIKAAAGGGGRGMRLVRTKEELAPSLAAARSEAIAAFGQSDLILEKLIRPARHIEFQIAADAHGAVIHLGERECSLQRRHQKIIEEAPSPSLTGALRMAMGEAAVAAARAAAYVNLGTVEFLLGTDGAFYFIEMNTRLQVEHPVTEAVTGLDLVALQISIAAGAHLPITQGDVHMCGHAIEARLCAEDAESGFLPQAGAIAAFRPPLGVRVDHWIAPGTEVSSHYDSLLAKIIAHGQDRAEATRKLRRALGDVMLLGLKTNLAYLDALVRSAAFAAADFHVQSIDDGEVLTGVPPGQHRLLAALAAALEAATGQGGLDRTVLLKNGAETIACHVARQGAGARVTGGGFVVAFGAIEIGPLENGARRVRFETDGVWRTAHFARVGTHIDMQIGAIAERFEDVTLKAAHVHGGGADKEIKAPMAGRIVRIGSEVGASVEKGAVLVVLEAMKMEHELKARATARVGEVRVKAGDQVSPRQVLMTLEPV